MGAPYWSVVKANITDEGRRREADLSRWWSEELVPEYVAHPGFVSGRRLKAVQHDGQVGSPPHEYLAVYEADSVETFNDAIAAGPPWRRWDAHIDEYLEYERTYYRCIVEYEASVASGRYWTIVKADVELDDDDLHYEFDAWYTERQLPDICSYPGVHRGWRLRVEPDKGELGPRGQHWWAVYEVSHPRDYVAANLDRSRRGAKPWDGIWQPYVSSFEVTFYEVLLEVDHVAAASAAGAAY